MNSAEVIDDLINKIVSGDHTDAMVDVDALLAHKLNDALDAKRQEVAASIYGQQAEEEPVEQESDESSIENGTDTEATE